METFFKPSRLAHDVKKWEKREARKKMSVREDRKAAAVWMALCEQIRARDKGECRVCGCQTARFGKGDPRLAGHVHHIQYRSAGGEDSLSNCLLVCGQCHADEHEHRIVIMGTAE